MPRRFSSPCHHFVRILLLTCLIALLLSTTPGPRVQAASSGWRSTGLMVAPRFGHTATLLPNGKVLVAGGYRDQLSYAVLKTAELYDPATATWTATGEMSSPRRNHTATLLNNGKVLIVGGYNSYDLPVNADLYDPATNTWSQTARPHINWQEPTATLLADGRVLVAGGMVASAELYDPTTNTWTVTGSLQYSRTAHTATRLKNGKVLVVGGGGFQSGSELYDPATGTWTSLPPLILNRHSHTAVLLANGKVMIVAGSPYSSSYDTYQWVELFDPATNTFSLGSSLHYPSSGLPTNTVQLPIGKLFYTDGSHAEIYDPAADRWTVLEDLPIGRSECTVTPLANGQVLITGGVSWSYALDSALLYQPGERFTTVPGGNIITSFHFTATRLADGRVLLAGGRSTPESDSLPSAYLYDPDDGAWTLTGAMSINRSWHTATLLNNGKVLVTGGAGKNCTGDYISCYISSTATAELYDPAAGTWTATSPMSVERCYHAAVRLLDGRVLVIGGGVNSYPGTVLNELYDPDTGTWSSANTAPNRSFFTATLLANGKVLIAGGMDANGYLTTSAELYDPQTNTWNATTATLYEHRNPTATPLPDGRILLLGRSSSSDYEDAEIYDPTTATWKAAKTPPLLGQYHTATLLKNGLVLVAGGDNATIYNKAQLYDPASNTWTDTGGMSIGRYMHSASLLSDGRVLVAGGLNATINASELVSGELYDPDTGTWSKTGRQMSGGLNHHTATLLPDSKVLMAGGTNGMGLPTTISKLYDPSTGLAQPTSPLQTPRSGHTATLLGSGQAIIVGGSSGSSILNSVERYDPLSGTWSSTGSLITARSAHTATLLLNGKVLAVGGTNGSAELASAELYDPAAGTWAKTGSLALSRKAHTAVLLPDGSVLVAGGLRGSSPISSAELYDPVSETWTTVTALSAARGNHSATLLPNGEVLVAGGSGTNGTLASTEIYAPGAHTWRSGGALTEARQGHTAVVLPNGKVLVEGGQNGSGAVASGELYDPATGRWLQTSSLVTPRAYHTATLLPTGMVLLIGGTAGPTAPLVELYDSAVPAWSAASSLPEPRGGQRAILLADGKVLMVSGFYQKMPFIYDPATGAWSSAANMADFHVNGTATLLPSGKVLVAGGQNNGWVVEIYDPKVNAWTTTARMKGDRQRPQATLLPDGRVLVTGKSEWYVGAVQPEIYDPATATWTETGPINYYRDGNTAILLENKKVLVFGGENNITGGDNHPELYDIATDTWRVTNPSLITNWNDSAALLSDGRALVVGSYGAEIFDPQTETWALTGQPNYKYYTSKLQRMQDGKILLVGKLDNSYAANRLAAELYDPQTGVWTMAGNLPYSVDGEFSVTLLPDDSVLVAGGTLFTYPQYTYVGSAARFTPDASRAAGWQPVLGAQPAPFIVGQPYLITGSGFRGAASSEAASGGTNSSAANVPLVRLLRLDNGAQYMLPLDSASSFTATSITIPAIPDLPKGHYLLTVFVNGVPSASKVVSVKYPGSISMSDMAFPYDGSPKTLNVTTTPLNKAVSFIYTGLAPTNYGPTSTPPVNAGTYTVQAEMLDGTYAGSAMAVLTINKAAQEISFSALPDTTFGAADIPFQVSASSGLPVSLNTGSGDPCTIVGNKIHLTSAGTCNITAAQAGSANYNPAQPVTRSFKIARANQTITFAPLTDRTLVEGDFIISASASSGLGVNFSTGSGDPCTVSGNTVHLAGAGTCNITAWQAGDANYNPADPVLRTFTITKASQTITFAPLSDRTLGDTDFSVSAAASSGLTVSFTVGSGDGCTISGTIVHLAREGACTVTASQPGSSLYSAAEPVARTFRILKPNPNLTQAITFFSIQDQTYGNPDFILNASASSGLPVSFSAAGQTACMVSGNIVHINNAGSCTITASQAGNDQYLPASPVTRTFSIAKADASIKVDRLVQIYDGYPKPIVVTTNPASLFIEITYTGIGNTVYGPSQVPPSEKGVYQVTIKIIDPNYQGNYSDTLTIYAWTMFVPVVVR